MSVYGGNVTAPPLLESAEATMVVIRSFEGAPVAILVRILSDDTWGLSTRGDADFDAVLTRYGITDTKEVPNAGN